jgi:hypothetical protein
LIAMALSLGQDKQTILSAREAALQQRLLHETETDQAQFAQDLIRGVVVHDVSRGRRALLHLQIAAALEHQPGDPPVEALAYHYACSEERAKAVAYLERAANHVLGMHALAEAKHYGREWLAVLEDVGQVNEAARAREKLGAILTPAARYDQALEAPEGATDAARARADQDGIVRLSAQLGEVYALKGSAERGLIRLQPLVERLADMAVLSRRVRRPPSTRRWRSSISLTVAITSK